MTHLTQGSASSTLTNLKMPWPSLAPTFRLVSQQAEIRTWHCLFTNKVKLNGKPSTRLEVNQNSSRIIEKLLKCIFTNWVIFAC